MNNAQSYSILKAHKYSHSFHSMLLVLEVEKLHAHAKCKCWANLLAKV